MSAPGTCPHCGKRALDRHCKTRSAGCTWLECQACRTIVDRRDGRYSPRLVVEKDTEG